LFAPSARFSWGAAAHDADLPPEFVLSMKIDAGESRKSCRVVWRLHHEFGVRFMD